MCCGDLAAEDVEPAAPAVEDGMAGTKQLFTQVSGMTLRVANYGLATNDSPVTVPAEVAEELAADPRLGPKPFSVPVKQKAAKGGKE